MVDDLRHHADLVAPDMPVGLDDAVDVGLHRGALQRAARLGLDGGGKIGVLDLLVAFEGDAVEHRGLGDMHDQPLAGAVDRDLVEQAGRDQRFQRRIARGFIELSVGCGMKIRADGFGIDAAIAFDDDGVARTMVQSRPQRSRRTSSASGCGQQSAHRQQPMRVAGSA